MHELPRTLKIATVWLLLATALFLAVQAFLAERQRPRVSTDGMGVIELRRAPDGHFHWPARLGGGEVDFLVDTGATRTALPQPLAERLGLPRGRAVRSSTAGGTVTGWESQVDLELAGGLQARADFADFRGQLRLSAGAACVRAQHFMALPLFLVEDLQIRLLAKLDLLLQRHRIELPAAGERHLFLVHLPVDEQAHRRDQQQPQPAAQQSAESAATAAAILLGHAHRRRPPTSTPSSEC